MNIELKGKLEFISLWNPIKLFTQEGEIDLREHFFGVFEKLNGKPVGFEWGNIFEIKSEPTEEYKLVYKNDGQSIGISVETDSGGASYLDAYLPMSLQDLNARSVIVNVTDEGFKITYDPTEEVFGTYYTDGNSCKVDNETAKKVCKITTSDTCIFCTFSTDGFYCQKFDSYSARQLLIRYGRGQMNATRIGNCAILGRKEDGEIK